MFRTPQPEMWYNGIRTTDIADAPYCPDYVMRQEGPFCVVMSLMNAHTHSDLAHVMLRHIKYLKKRYDGQKPILENMLNIILDIRLGIDGYRDLTVDPLKLMQQLYIRCKDDLSGHDELDLALACLCEVFIKSQRIGRQHQQNAPKDGITTRFMEIIALALLNRDVDLVNTRTFDTMKLAHAIPDFKKIEADMTTSMHNIIYRLYNSLRFRRSLSRRHTQYFQTADSIVSVSDRDYNAQPSAWKSAIQTFYPQFVHVAQHLAIGAPFGHTAHAICTVKCDNGWRILDSNLDRSVTLERYKECVSSGLYKSDAGNENPGFYKAMHLRAVDSIPFVKIENSEMIVLTLYNLRIAKKSPINMVGGLSRMYAADSSVSIKPRYTQRLPAAAAAAALLPSQPVPAAVDEYVDKDELESFWRFIDDNFSSDEELHKINLIIVLACVLASVTTADDVSDFPTEPAEFTEDEIEEMWNRLESEDAEDDAEDPEDAEDYQSGGGRQVTNVVLAAIIVGISILGSM